MRYALQQRLRERILSQLPTAQVSRAYDGPSGYVLIVSAPAAGQFTVRNETDWRRLQPRLKKLAVS